MVIPFAMLAPVSLPESVRVPLIVHKVDDRAGRFV
jgi:hypothetical protein